MVRLLYVSRVTSSAEAPGQLLLLLKFDRPGLLHHLLLILVPLPLMEFQPHKRRRVQAAPCTYSKSSTSAAPAPSSSTSSTSSTPSPSPEGGGKWRRYAMAIAEAVLRDDRKEAKRLAQLASMP